MIKNIKSFSWIILAALVFLGCQEEFKLEETPISEADATFTVTQGAEGANYFVFSNSSDGFIKSWDFGNGSSAQGNEVTGYFPFEGEYQVTLTVYNGGGSVTTSQMITVDATDPEICNVEVLQLLTGGCDAPDGKTWVIDADRAGHFGLGPSTSFFAEWYAAGANEKVGAGYYDDEYTFILNNSVFNMETNGDVYLNSAQASNFPGAYDPGVGDLTAPYEARVGTYSISMDESGNNFINTSATTFIGYYTGTNSYQILSIDENEMFLRVEDRGNAGFFWYQRLIRQGYAPLGAGFTSSAAGLVVTFTNTSSNAETYSWDFGDGNMSTEESPMHTYAAGGTYTVTLTVTSPGQEEVATADVTVIDIPKEIPLTWEDADVLFGTFGGTVFNVIDNPDPSGINTSARVGEFVKGTEFSFAGLAMLLDEAVDFSANTTLSMKIWSPVATNVILKIEAEGDAATFTEDNVAIPSANEWVEVSFDFSGAQANLKNLVVFADTDNNNGGTFYIDDIQFQYQPVITLDDLVGSGAKTWRMKDGADTWGVGPFPGSPEYFPGWGNDISGDRPCIWNDEWVFNINGTVEYKTNGDFYNEAYFGLGLGDGCTSDAELTGTDAEPWGSGTHAFALSQGSSSTPAYLTLIGQGAFIGLAKAYNGGEYTAPPPNANANVTYTIYSYTNDGVNEEMGVSVEVAAGVFWSFVLTSN